MEESQTSSKKGEEIPEKLLAKQKRLYVQQ